MTVDPRVVAELRAMFLNGATPSRLVRHIAALQAGDPDWATTVESYFVEAFSVTFVMEQQFGDFDLDRLNVSKFDGEILRDMVGRIAAWRDSGSAWCDGLTVSPDDLKMNDRIRPESHPALADSWGTMTPRAKEFVRQAMVNAQGYYERMQVLVRLVERLQEQVIELERQSEVARV